jgi:hypothetical protein
MTTVKKSLRRQYIDQIMKEKYGDDDPKYDDSNMAFLESLSLDELANMCDGSFEDEFELDGEVKDIDFCESELDYFED